MFNKKLMKRNKAKTKNDFMRNKRIFRKKGCENFEANKWNACEMDLCSLRFASKRKKNISENRTPYSLPQPCWVTCLLVLARAYLWSPPTHLSPFGNFLYWLLTCSMVTQYLCLDVQKKFLSYSIHGAKQERRCSSAVFLLCTALVEIWKWFKEVSTEYAVSIIIFLRKFLRPTKCTQLSV
jgi:hypothetical protein